MIDLTGLKGKDEMLREKKNHDAHHGVRQKPEFQPGDSVWLTDKKIWGRIIESAGAPRSCNLNNQPNNQMSQIPKSVINFAQLSAIM
ncbi:unnamed protein product, partial [Allacma fusca]